MNSILSRTKRLSRLLLDAIQGVPGDNTQGPISQAVILLAIPMVLSMALGSLFSVVDIFFVGSLGSNAIAAIGMTETLLMQGYAIAAGLEMGATAIVSRRIGERDLEGAAVATVQVLMLGALVSLLITVPGVLFAPQLLRFMGASPALVLYTVPYMRIMFSGCTAIVMLYATSAIFRATGDGAIAMRALALSNGFNLLLVPCLVKGLFFFPEWGLVGAAVATTTARTVGTLYLLWHLVGGLGQIKIHMHHWIVSTKLMFRIIHISVIASIQILISNASWLVLINIVSAFGTDAVAGYTLGLRILLFVTLPAVGLSNAAATMTGQMLGAGKPDRAEKAVWLTGLYNLGFLGFIGMFIMIFAPRIVGWFTTDATVQNYAVACQWIITPGFLLCAFGIVVVYAFNGVGDTWTPTWISFMAYWVFEIPVAWLLAHTLRMGPQGVFLAVPLAFSVFTILSVVIFRRGHWKTHAV